MKICHTGANVTIKIRSTQHKFFVTLKSVRKEILHSAVKFDVGEENCTGKFVIFTVWKVCVLTYFPTHSKLNNWLAVLPSSLSWTNFSIIFSQKFLFQLLIYLRTFMCKQLPLTVLWERLNYKFINMTLTIGLLFKIWSITHICHFIISKWVSLSDGLLWTLWI